MYSINRIGLVLKTLPRATFAQAVEEHRADRHNKGFTCWRHLVAMVYAQLSDASSLRQVEAGFNQHVCAHYHLGVGPIRRSTLSEANSKRNPEVFAQTVRALMAQAGRQLRHQRDDILYLLDSTSIALKGRYLQPAAHKSCHGNKGMKVHVLYESGSGVPMHQTITASNVNDIEEGKLLGIEPGATYVFDKGYCNYNWWQSISLQGARWVSRFKRDAALVHRAQLPIDLLDEGVILSDTIVAFQHKRPRGGHVNSYTGELRRVEVAREGKAPIVLATNDLHSPASQIAQLYKDRWQVELFFKWIKQHLGIKRFMGTSANAIRIQLLTALITYLLVALLKSATKFTGSMWMLLAELRAGLFQSADPRKSWWSRQRQKRELIAAVQPGLFT